MQAQPYDYLPLWGIYVLTVGTVLLSVEGGFRVGRYSCQVAGKEKEAPVGAMVGAVLALLAFMLAFTFGIASSRFDKRKQLVLDEANAIGTTYLRADWVSEPARTEIRSLLKKYVDVRLKGVQSGKVDQAIAQSEQLQRRLWSQAVVLAKSKPDSVVDGLFIQSLNELIDIHSKRVIVGGGNRIPASIWAALYFLTVVAMGAVGYNSGLTCRRSLVVDLVLAITFSAVILLIFVLDRPLQGILTVSQQALIDLQRSLESLTVETLGR